MLIEDGVVDCLLFFESKKAADTAMANGRVNSSNTKTFQLKNAPKQLLFFIYPQAKALMANEIVV